MDKLLKHGTHECNSCGNVFERFEHCGHCGTTRKIPKMKKGRFGHHLDQILDEYERPVNNGRASAVLFAALLIIVSAGCLCALLFIIEGVL